MQRSEQQKSTRHRAARAARRRPVFAASFPSEIQSVEPIVAKVLSALDGWGCSQGPRNDIEVALREALANAILHGNSGNPRKRVRVECFEQPDKSVVLVVRDNGDGFDPDRLHDPTRPENLFRDCGRGIFLIRHFMDEVSFGRGGREIRMRKVAESS